MAYVSTAAAARTAATVSATASRRVPRSTRTLASSQPAAPAASASHSTGSCATNGTRLVPYAPNAAPTSDTFTVTPASTRPHAKRLDLLLIPAPAAASSSGQAHTARLCATKRATPASDGAGATVEESRRPSHCRSRPFRPRTPRPRPRWRGRGVLALAGRGGRVLGGAPRCAYSSSTACRRPTPTRRTLDGPSRSTRSDEDAGIETSVADQAGGRREHGDERALVRTPRPAIRSRRDARPARSGPAGRARAVRQEPGASTAARYASSRAAAFASEGCGSTLT